MVTICNNCWFNTLKVSDMTLIFKLRIAFKHIAHFREDRHNSKNIVSSKSSLKVSFCIAMYAKCSPDELRKDLEMGICAYERTRTGDYFVVLSPKTENFDLCQSSRKWAICKWKNYFNLVIENKLKKIIRNHRFLKPF